MARGWAFAGRGQEAAGIVDFTVWTGLPEVASQMSMRGCLSASEETATSLPPALNCPLSHTQSNLVCTRLPSVTSQRVIVPTPRSKLSDLSVSPSSHQAIAPTQLACSRSRGCGGGESVHSFTFPSAPPDARRLPFGSQATDLTCST